VGPEERANEHLARVEVLRQLAESCKLLPPPACDWEIVALFYMAVHKVGAYLALGPGGGTDVTTHTLRWRAIDAAPQLKKGNFRKHLRALQDLSEEVRYTPSFGADAGELELARDYFRTVGSMLDGKTQKRLNELKQGPGEKSKKKLKKKTKPK